MLFLAVMLVVIVGWGKDIVAAADVPTTPGAVKWHPGHYYAPMPFMRANPSIMAQIYAELKATPALRGLQVRFPWPELEPEEGRYDFKAIEQILAELAPMNKHLVILLELKSFSPQVFPVPTYQAEYAGPRTDFRETIFFAPAVKTDPSGQATISVPLSDAITSFRVVAEGVGAEGHAHVVEYLLRKAGPAHGKPCQAVIYVVRVFHTCRETFCHRLYC